MAHSLIARQTRKIPIDKIMKKRAMKAINKRKIVGKEGWGQKGMRRRLDERKIVLSQNKM